MEMFESLSSADKDLLLKFPVYISLLAADHDGKLDKEERETAVHFSHIKTFSSPPLLTNFYKEADRVFEENIQQIDHSLPQNKTERDAAIKNELAKIEAVLEKLDSHFAAILFRSMKSFKEHVSKAHRNALEYLVFPFPIKGITD